MNLAWDQRLPDLLAPWDLPDARIGAELTDLGDRSRVWRVDTDRGAYAAKLTFDSPAFVEPGLKIAAALDRTGIPTGAPLPDADGRLCRPVGRPGDWPWTLALHTFVVGTPLDWGSEAAPAQTGDLLGRVHLALTRLAEVPRPAGHLLDFYAARAEQLGSHRGAALDKALSAIADFRTRTPLSEGVLYGDPAPEILQTLGQAPLALIDWGTPSWGPLLFDLVSWQLFLTSRQPPNKAEDAEQRFLAAYRDRCPIDDHQLAARGMMADLHRAVQDTWAPEPPVGAAD
ncbi:phosphotransferase enzyme family protein [Streptomyces inhibens]|uniref:phosphotransferase enzyme family protein n=1 Tax=Streptomyces inhibens TaxID=2293571 RepID=UPI0036A14C73